MAGRVWRFTLDVRISHFGDSAVLLNVRTARYFSLNRTGALVCAGIAESSDTHSIIERVQREFSEADPEGVARDVRDFLREMEDLRLCRQIEKE